MSPGQVRTGIGDGAAKKGYRSQIGQPRDLDDGFSNTTNLPNFKMPQGMHSPQIPAAPCSSSCQQVLNNPGPGNIRIGQTFRTATVRECQLPVVDPQLIQDRRVQVRNADPILNRPVAKLVRGSVNMTGPEATARHDRTERMAVMVASVSAFRDRQPTKLTRPHNYHIIKKSAIL